jgi:hypothetical protein
LRLAPLCKLFEDARVGKLRRRQVLIGEHHRSQLPLLDQLKATCPKQGSPEILGHRSGVGVPDVFHFDIRKGHDHTGHRDPNLIALPYLGLLNPLGDGRYGVSLPDLQDAEHSQVIIYPSQRLHREGVFELLPFAEDLKFHPLNHTRCRSTIDQNLIALEADDHSLYSGKGGGQAIGHNPRRFREPTLLLAGRTQGSPLGGGPVLSEHLFARQEAKH